MERVKLAKRSDFGSKAKVEEAVVGHWYSFGVVSVGQQMVGYGKIVEIDDEGYALVDKYFELPSYRPYAAHKWFDNLPCAIAKED